MRIIETAYRDFKGSLTVILKGITILGLKISKIA